MTGPNLTRRVFLIGFMGAGKTSVGEVLSQRLGWKFHDLDKVIENREGTSIAAIFADAGEPAFRSIESAVLTDLLEKTSTQDAIIALGGGTFVQEKNREILHKAAGITVLLDAPLEELERRCHVGTGARPLARDSDHFRQLFASRQAAYDLARFRIQTAAKTINDVASEIEGLLTRRGSAGMEVTK